MTFDIDGAIFIGFLIANIALGLASSRGVRGIADFALSNRNFSTATIAATIVATWISGEFFFIVPAEIYNGGLNFIWIIVLAQFLCVFLIGTFFAPRMGEFLGKLSIAEAMGSLYGERVRVITAIVGFIGAAGLIAIQLKIAGLIFEYALGLLSIYGIILAAIIVTLYSSLGGIKAVTFTDIIQFFMFGVMIPVLAYFLLNSMDNNINIIDSLSNNPLFDYKKIFDFTQPTTLNYLFLLIPIPGFDPAIFQRISMAKDTIQVRRSFIIAAFTCLLVVVLVCWIGTLLLVTAPNIDPNDAVKHIISKASLILGFKGIILAGIMAMIMSTVDSYINSSSVMIVHDFCKPLRIKFIKNELFSARIVSILIGIFSLFLALRDKSLLELVIITSSLYMPIITVPFIIAIVGFRSSEKAVLLGMSAGLSTVVIWDYVLHIKAVNCIPVAMLANLVILLASHYLLKQEGGWVGIKDPGHLIQIRQKRQLALKKLCQDIKTFDLIKIFKQNTQKGDGLMSIMGFFVMISAFSSVHTLPKEFQINYSYLLDIIYPMTLFSSSALISYPLWLPRWRENNVIAAIVWNIIMFFVLICFSFLMVLISNFSEIQLMVFMVNIIVISSLVRWQWALFTIILGTSIVTFYYKNYLIIDLSKNDFLLSQFEIVYLLLLISSSLILFLRPKQEHQELTEEKNEYLAIEVGYLEAKNDQLVTKAEHLEEKVDHFFSRVLSQQQEIERLGKVAKTILNNVNHELRLPVGNVMNFAEMLCSGLENYDKSQLRMLSDEVYRNSTRLSTMILNMLDLAMLDAKNIDLKKETTDLSQILLERLGKCKNIYLDKKPISFKLDITPSVIANVDPNYIKQVFDNLIINALNYSKEGTITIILNCDRFKANFSIADEGIGIPKTEIYDIFEPFRVSSKTATPACGRGVGLSLCKTAIEAHGGSIQAQSDGNRGAQFTFALPL